MNDLTRRRLLARSVTGRDLTRRLHMMLGHGAALLEKTREGTSLADVGVSACLDMVYAAERNARIAQVTTALTAYSLFRRWVTESPDADVREALIEHDRPAADFRPDPVTGIAAIEADVRRLRESIAAQVVASTAANGGRFPEGVDPSRGRGKARTRRMRSTANRRISALGGLCDNDIPYVTEDLAWRLVEVETTALTGMTRTTVFAHLITGELLARLPTEVALPAVEGRIEYRFVTQLARRLRTAPIARTDEQAVVTEVCRKIVPDLLAPAPRETLPDENGVEPLVTLPRIQTMPELNRAITAALIEADPEGDHAANPQREPSGPATWFSTSEDGDWTKLWARLPAPQARLVRELLQRTVRNARAAGDTRPTEQIRADAVRDALTYHLSGHCTPTAETPTPTTEELADRLSTDPILTNERGEAIGWPTGDRPVIDDLCPDTGYYPPPDPPTIKAQFVVTMSLEALLEALGDHPAHLEGHGHITHALARDLALNGTFRCAALDHEGTVLGLGRPTHVGAYQATQELKTYLRLRYRYCTIPGCTRAAADCDTEHATPYPEGATCECNLHPMCRTHHNLKTQGLLTVVKTHAAAGGPHGDVHITTPSGRRYRTRPAAA